MGELPKASPQQLQAERDARRKAQQADRNAVLDRFMAFFDRIIRFAEKHAGLSKPAPEDGLTRPL